MRRSVLMRMTRAPSWPISTSVVRLIGEDAQEKLRVSVGFRVIGAKRLNDGVLQLFPSVGLLQ